jgi:predicted AlkP superfamily phosphohydrolase/phosphomutase
VAARSVSVLVVGLDGAPALLFERWLDELPTLRSLTARGAYGVLRSCDPPITVPAWTSMTSSRSPGALGLYGFRNRRDRSYDGPVLADSRAVRAPRVWDVLSARGRDVIVLGVPQTYPVSQVNGVMVSCFQAPDGRAYTHPAELELVDYMTDVPAFRSHDKERIRRDAEEMTDKRFRLAEQLLTTRPWDLFFMVEMATDRIQHALWRSQDAVLDYYRLVDDRLGRLLRLVDDDTAVLVVSDHGAKSMDGCFQVNEWLRRNGYLTLRAEPSEPTPLSPELVEWERTVAWSDGGFHARVYMNVAGREPAGIVAASEYDDVRDELRSELAELGEAHRPEDLYDEVNGVAPDLLAYFGDLHVRCSALVGTDSLYSRENDTGPDEANHDHDGVYILTADGVRTGRRATRDLRDVAPTILALLGEPIPAEMEGSPLL